MQEKGRVEETILLYKNLGWKSLFAKIRFYDAPYLTVEKLVPQKGKIIDLGCGEGFFSNFIAVNSHKRNVLGIELDRDRVSVANRGLKNVKFVQGDALSFKLPKCDCIILFHLMHHLPSYDSQEYLLEKCSKALRKSGKLMIIEIDRKVSLKFLITWLTDHFLVPWIFEKRVFSKIYFRSKKDWLGVLKEHGFVCREIKPTEGFMPFEHLILECELRAK